jgi:hypothetical protein
MYPVLRGVEDSPIDIASVLPTSIDEIIFGLDVRGQQCVPLLMSGGARPRPVLYHANLIIQSWKG